MSRDLPTKRHRLITNDVGVRVSKSKRNSGCFLSKALVCTVTMQWHWWQTIKDDSAETLKLQHSISTNTVSPLRPYRCALLDRTVAQLSQLAATKISADFHVVYALDVMNAAVVVSACSSTTVNCSPHTTPPPPSPSPLRTTMTTRYNNWRRFFSKAAAF